MVKQLLACFLFTFAIQAEDQVIAQNRPPVQEKGFIVIKDTLDDPESEANTSSFVIDEVKYAGLRHPETPREMKPEFRAFLERTINFKSSVAKQLGMMLGILMKSCKTTFGAHATPVKLVIIKYGDMHEAVFTQLRFEGCAPQGLEIYERFPRECFANFTEVHKDFATFQYVLELTKFCAHSVHGYKFDASPYRLGAFAEQSKNLRMPQLAGTLNLETTSATEKPTNLNDNERYNPRLDSLSNDMSESEELKDLKERIRIVKKHAPEEYEKAAAEQRLALEKGPSLELLVKAARELYGDAAAEEVLERHRQKSGVSSRSTGDNSRAIKSVSTPSGGLDSSVALLAEASSSDSTWSNAGPLLFFLAIFGGSGLIVGLLAARKNRNAWAWGLVGSVLLIPTLLVLMFVPFLCPKCKQSISYMDSSSGKCPKCGAA